MTRAFKPSPLRVTLVVTAVVVVIALVTALVAVPAVHDLNAARGALEGAASDLTHSDVDRADGYLEEVEHGLRGLPARALGVVPVVGPSLGAMRAVATAARPVLAAGLSLKDRLDEVRREGLLAHGRIRMGRLDSLRGPVEAEGSALARLDAAVRAHRDGWVAPPVWDALDEIAGRVEELRSDAHGFAGLLGVIDDLLGATGPRRYLVMLVNNAELRGGGGVLSGVGTITIDRGRIELGKFYPYEALVRSPYQAVPAPAAYVRRYGRYQANTTLWVNATYSPDVPDDALVAARLYKLVNGVGTNGALVVDPRGLAALLPSDARVPVPGTDLELTPGRLPAFIYSKAYSLFHDNTRRRAAILEVGARAFRDVVESGSADPATTEAAAAAFAAGHLRLVSFDAHEEAALDQLDATGALQPPDDDSLLVAVQNFGGGGKQGSKLDYWADRSVEHRCTVSDDGSAECVDDVTLTNHTPPGLTSYVAGHPYGLLRSYVETFVPATASLESVTVDGVEAGYYPNTEAGQSSVAVYAKVAPGDATSIEIDYHLPSNGAAFSFVASPQPLARDARLKVALELPEDWAVDGPGRVHDGVLTYSGAFVRRVEIAAGPDQRTGIPGLWDSLSDFWREPVF